MGRDGRKDDFTEIIKRIFDVYTVISSMVITDMVKSMVKAEPKRIIRPEGVGVAEVEEESENEVENECFEECMNECMEERNNMVLCGKLCGERCNEKDR
ncbi:MAG: hypothetical protein DRJ31_07875 [Candidatus Methanomethylicota archaeon]|uniref:Uncharacterized protein n=1 Tax=Thermoproteota archaeon TaxID=2056631 RepID=A0A497EMF4_9CREN|nr:MAG: hypothetical protein DRJ31_07875 [Candidatus Verstraetearchaeota archaeon]